MKRLFTIAMSFLVLLTGGFSASAYDRESTEILDGEMLGKPISVFPYTKKLEKVGNRAFAGSWYLEQFRTEYGENVVLVGSWNDYDDIWNIYDGTPYNLSYIGDYAFAGCENLTVLDVPHVTYFGDYAFFGCPKISSIKFSRDITHIGDYAFGYTGVVNTDARTKEVSITDIKQNPSVILRVYPASGCEEYVKKNLFNCQYFDDHTGEIYIVGDFNANGEVSIDDCQEMLVSYVDRLAGKTTIPKSYTVRNDLNNDNRTDVSDVQMLLRYYTEVKTAGKTNYTWFDLRKDMGMV